MKAFASSLFLLLALLAYFPGKLAAQPPATQQPVPPDCVLFINLAPTGAGGTSPSSLLGFDNRFLGCQTWQLMYQATGAGTVSLRFESAAGAVVAGAFGAYAGATASGINPNTSTTGAASTFTNGIVDIPWVQVALTGTFSGRLNGVVYGWKTPPGAGPGSTSCPGTSATPCVVDGPTAAGSPPTTPPVLIAGQDGAPGNIRTLKTDANGSQIPSNASSANADAVNNTNTGPTGAAAAILFQRNLPYRFGGTTWDREFGCINQAAITLSAGTDVVIVTGIASTNTRICHISFASDTSASVTIRQGTGTTCLTNTLGLTGAYAAVTAMALDFGPDSSLRTTIAARDMCIHTSVAATLGGVVIYAVF